MFIKSFEEIVPYSDAVVSVEIYESGEGVDYQVGQLASYINATFEVDPEAFRPGQTQCMAFVDKNNKWDASICKTDIDVANLQIKCSCNAFSANRISVLTDPTLKLAAPITFPERKDNKDFSKDKQRLNVNVDDISQG